MPNDIVPDEPADAATSEESHTAKPRDLAWWLAKAGLWSMGVGAALVLAAGAAEAGVTDSGAFHEAAAGLWIAGAVFVAVSLLCSATGAFLRTREIDRTLQEARELMESIKESKRSTERILKRAEAAKRKHEALYEQAKNDAGADGSRRGRRATNP